MKDTAAWIKLGVPFVLGLCAAILVMQVLGGSMGSVPTAQAEEHNEGDEGQNGEEQSMGTLKVHRIELVDSEGRTRGLLGFEAGGGGLIDNLELPSLRLTGIGEKQQLRIGFRRMGVEPVIEMADLNGEVVGRVSVNVDGDLAAEAGQGQERVELKFTPRGAHLWMQDEKVGIFYTITNGNASLVIKHDDGSGISLSVGSDHEPTIRFVGEGGELLKTITSTQDAGE